MNYMKKEGKNKLFYTTTPLIFIVNAFLDFIVKLFVSDYFFVTSPLDNIIPFIPVFIYIYNIWYPFELFSLYYIFKRDRKVYIRTIISIILSFSIAHVIFYIFPTTVNRPIVDSYNSLTSFIVYLTYKFDTPAINCLPSGHCTLCFILIFGIFKSENISFKSKLSFLITNLLIVLSTILVKQHAVYDVLVAFIISYICFYIICNFK